MTWISHLLEYPSSAAFLLQVIDVNDKIFTSLHTYFTSLLQSFSPLLDRPKPTPTGLEFPSKFVAVSDCSFAPYLTAHRLLSKLVPRISTIREEYHSKVETIRTAMLSDLDTLSEARSRSNSAYLAYQQCADDLRIGADKKSGNLKELKSLFVNAQARALDLHTNMNEITVQTAVKMEKALSDYEEAEQWKLAQIQAFLQAVADWGLEFGKQFETANRKFQRMKESLPDDQFLSGLFDGSKFPNARTCEDFVVVRVETEIAQLVEGKVAFPDAAKERKTLYRVTQKCVGDGNRLTLAAGDIVCQLEDKRDSILAATINDTQGLVPKSALYALT